MRISVLGTPECSVFKQFLPSLGAAGVGNPPTSYSSLSGPPRPKSKKSLTTVSRGLQPQRWKKFRKSLESGTKKEPKPKLLSPDIFWWGLGVFHVKGWGPKSSICPSKPGKSNCFGGISRDFAGISRKCPKSLRKKVCVQLLAPIERTFSRLFTDCLDFFETFSRLFSTVCILGAL